MSYSDERLPIKDSALPRSDDDLRKRRDRFHAAIIGIAIGIAFFLIGIVFTTHITIDYNWVGPDRDYPFYADEFEYQSMLVRPVWHIGIVLIVVAFVLMIACGFEFMRTIAFKEAKLASASPRSAKAGYAYPIGPGYPVAHPTQHPVTAGIPVESNTDSTSEPSQFIKKIDKRKEGLIAAPIAIGAGIAAFVFGLLLMTPETSEIYYYHPFWAASAVLVVLGMIMITIGGFKLMLTITDEELKPVTPFSRHPIAVGSYEQPQYPSANQQLGFARTPPPPATHQPPPRPPQPQQLDGLNEGGD